MPELARPALNFGGELDSPIRRQLPTPAGAGLLQESIGECLSRERQSNGKTLIDVSLELKIAPHHLIAIENDSFEALPGRAYAIGFVRSYAAYLGLDAQNLVARLKTEMAGPDVKLPVARPSARPVHKDQVNAARVEAGNAREPEIARFPAVEGAAPPVSPRERSAPILSAAERSVPISSPVGCSVPMWSLPELPVRQLVVPGLMIVLMTYFGYSVLASALRVAPPAVIPVPERLAAEAGLTPKKVRPPAVATVQQDARVLHEPSLAPSATPAAPRFATVEKSAPISREPALAPSRSYAPPPVAAAGESAPIAREPALYPSGQVAVAQSDSGVVQLKPVFHPPLPLGQRYGDQNRNSRVTLRVHRPTHVAVLGTRNHVFINRVLRAGDTYRVPNMSSMKLNAADGGAIEVILDDNTVGFAGEDGVVARGLSLQPQSIITRYHRPQD